MEGSNKIFCITEIISLSKKTNKGMISLYKLIEKQLFTIHFTKKAFKTSMTFLLLNYLLDFLLNEHTGILTNYLPQNI